MRKISLSLYFVAAMALSDALGAFLPALSLEYAANRMKQEWLFDAESSITASYTMYDNNQIVLRAFDVSNGGFILLSGSDGAYPLLGYSQEGSFSGEMSPALLEWLEMYKEQILQIEEMRAEGVADIHPMWNNLLHSSFFPFPENTTVGPLLTCNWNQGKYYNAFCPTDTAGPGDKVYAGCVATAMGMAMHHYKYPAHGIGSHAYYAGNYGLLSVNFAAAQYDWYAMENTIDNHYNDMVASLLYHCGVGVEMNYSPNGSGAFMWDARDALVNFFGYSNSAALVYKSSYSDSGWKTLVKQQLDENRPLIYAGYPNGGGSGHAFVLDGYQGTDHFHFNWGWSAAANGYFYLNALNPGGNDFATGQQAIINLYPGSNYPSPCGGASTITLTRGMLFDGSGPENYAENSNCIWTLNPGNVERFILSIDKLKLGDAGDGLDIYAGTDTNGILLYSFHSDTVLQNIVIEEDAITIRFKSNGSLNADGFSLSFMAVLNDYCKGTTNIVAASGTLTDGSGVDNYRDASLCKWNIDAGNGMPLGLTFSMLDLGQGDFVRVYDVGTQPGVVLGQFYGNQLPPMIIANSGKMLVLFYADQQLNADGWDAEWVSGPSIGLPEVVSTALRLYPNPTQSECRLEFPEQEGNVEVRLLDFSGRQVGISVQQGAGFATMDVSALQAGLYFVVLISNSGVHTKCLEVHR